MSKGQSEAINLRRTDNAIPTRTKDKALSKRQYTKNLSTNPTKNWGSTPTGWVCSSCSTSGTSLVALFTSPVISNE